MTILSGPTVAILGVPFILSDYHRMAAEKTIASVRYSRGRLFSVAIANGLRQNSDDLAWISNTFTYAYQNDKNVLARAWNAGIEVAQANGADLILISNLDIRFHSQAIDRLVDAVQRYPDHEVYSCATWQTEHTLEDAQLTPGVSEGCNWSCFMVRPSFLEVTGGFDEVFAPAYQEDSDMTYRLSLLGKKRCIARDAIVYHTEGGTLRGCLTIKGLSATQRLQISSAIMAGLYENDRRYMLKWGGLPQLERFKVPYNGCGRPD